MLQSILSIWDKKEEKYCFTNVSDHLKTVLSSILPKGVPMSRPALPSTDTTISFGKISMTSLFFYKVFLIVSLFFFIAIVSP